ncbi:hypothetical protein V4U86_08165 [Mycobacterium sp. AMU20-3851]|uniref:hypothetical protein n=1 Tax=Mycobacterium sp. AMU20-3851 TaxID=3122055 RepID=UPI003754F6C8
MPTDRRGATSVSPPDQADGLELTAEEAEALAAEAEAAAAAAAARAKVLRLRREAEASEGDEHHEDVLTDADADADADAEDEFDDEPVSTRGRTRAILTYVAAALAVIGVAALASTSAWIMVTHQQAEHQRDLGAEFSAAARQGVVSLMSLNFNSAEQDVQRILDNSTGEFRKDFEKEHQDFAKVAESSKVITEATVTATAVKSMTENTADVLVSAFSTITNEQGAKDDPRTWRLIVSMAREGDQIKMAKVEFAP